MKLKLLFTLSLISTLCFSDELFSFVNSEDGYSYIQINENLDSFSFSPDWHSLGAAGKVGYVVYPNGLQGNELASYMEANANNPEFSKKINNGVIDLGSLQAGDRVGFYEVRPNGGTYTHSSFEEWHDKTWLAFDKNGGHGKDEWMSIGEVDARPSSPQSPSGAPLPGALAVLLVGGVGCLINKRK